MAEDKQVQELADGWMLAIRLAMAMVEQHVSPGRERDYVLRHLSRSRSPIAGLAREREVLAARLAQVIAVAARMYAVVRRYEPHWLDTLTAEEAETLINALQLSRPLRPTAAPR